MSERNPESVKQWVVEPELPTGIYRHYKGGMYLVLGIAQHTEIPYEPECLHVVYVSMNLGDGPRMRIRPLSNFLQDVYDDSSNPHPRFEYMGNYFKWKAPQNDPPKGA